VSLNEEIGRNYHTLDTDPYSWKDYSDIEVNIYASSHNDKWVAQVKSHTNPELSTMERSFGSETEANHWARSQVEYIKRHTMNENLLRKYVRNILTEEYIPPSALGERFGLYCDIHHPDNTAGFVLYDVEKFEKLWLQDSGYDKLFNYRFQKPHIHAKVLKRIAKERFMKSIVAAIMIEKTYPGKFQGEGGCNDAYEVKYAFANEKGYGPTLYDLVMSISPDGIYSDRESVSGNARKVWNTYVMRRPDVKKKYLDINNQTPTMDDNCSGKKWGNPVSSRSQTFYAAEFVKQFYPEYWPKVEKGIQSGHPAYKGSLAWNTILNTVISQMEDEGVDWDEADKEIRDEYRWNFDPEEFYEKYPWDVHGNRGPGQPYLNVSHNIEGDFNADFNRLVDNHKKCFNDLIDETGYYDPKDTADFWDFWRDIRDAKIPTDDGQEDFTATYVAYANFDMN